MRNMHMLMLMFKISKAICTKIKPGPNHSKGGFGGQSPLLLHKPWLPKNFIFKTNPKS